VLHRSELVVAGNRFLTFHRACFFGVRGRRWRLRLGYPLNGSAFWMFFLGINSVLIALGLALGPSDGLARVATAANSGILFLRLVCWMGFEARVPE
jgi:hypothetical protein